MTLNPVLSSSNYDKLRSTRYAGDTYLSVLSNRVVYSGRINGQPTGASFAEVNVDETAGDYADVRAGMRVQVGFGNGYDQILYDGRIRKATGNGSTLYIAETSRPLPNNFVFRVLDDFPIAPRKPRIVDGAFFVDYDETFETLPPLVTDLDPVYVGFTASGVLTVAFAPTVIASADGATIAAHEWEVGDGTITVGTSASQNITVTFPAGERWVHYTATDSNGVAFTRHVLVLAYDSTDDTGLQLAYDTLATSNRLGEGVSASVTTYGDVSNWFTRQLVVVWTTDDYAGDAGPIASNVAFYGRRASAGDGARYNDEGRVEQQTQIDLDGTIAQLGEGIAFPATLEDVASATDWFDVKSLTIWRGIYTILTRFTTAASVVGVSFGDTGDTYRIGDTSTEGATAWEQALDLAQSIAAAVQERWTGALDVSRYAVLLEDADDRANLDTVANWTDADWFSLNLREDDVDTVAAVTVYAGSYNPASGVTEAYQVIAPGEGGGEGANNFTVNRQILRAGANTFALFEARKRAGNLYAQRQPLRQLTVTHPDGYWWLLPEARAWFTFTVPVGALLGGNALDTGTLWYCREVSITHNAIEGTREVTAVYTEESDGYEGAYIPPEIVESDPFVPPDPIAFPEPDPGIASGDLPLDDVDDAGGTGEGSYNEDDDSVDASCNGGGTLTIGGWDFARQCVQGQGVSLQYADLPQATLTMTLLDGGATVATSSWGISGTEVLQALDEAFAASVEADRVEITLTFSGDCAAGTMRFFSVRVNEDTHSDGCQDVFPDIHAFPEASLVLNETLELGNLPYDVVALLIRLEAADSTEETCGFGQEGVARIQWPTPTGIDAIGGSVSILAGVPTRTLFQGTSEALQALQNAGIITGDADSTAPLTIVKGTEFEYLGAGPGASSACYPVTIQAWAVMDLNSKEAQS